MDKTHPVMLVEMLRNFSNHWNDRGGRLDFIDYAAAHIEEREEDINKLQNIISDITEEIESWSDDTSNTGLPYCPMGAKRIKTILRRGELSVKEDSDEPLV